MATANHTTRPLGQTPAKRGRKLQYGELTVVIRVPASQAAAIRSLLDASVLDKLASWQQKSIGKSRQPRWSYACRILAELDSVLTALQKHRDQQSVSSEGDAA